MKTVLLRGAGSVGLFDPMAPRAKAVLNPPSRQAKLGRLPGKPAAHAPRLAEFLPAGGAWVPPEIVDWSPKALESIGRDFGNRDWGNCVIAGKAHALGVWTGNDSDSGGEVVATDDECVREYHRVCGPGDPGCYIGAVLDEMVRNGLTLGGQKRKLDGYVAVDAGNPSMVKAAIALFGSLCIGLEYLQAWQSSNVWANVNSPSLGGHDISAVSYDPRGVVVMSWGARYLIPWDTMGNSRIVQECYAMASPNWYNGDRVAPSGLDVPGLRAAFAALAGGHLPDVPVPPVPPVPPRPAYNLSLTGTIDGNGAVCITGQAAPPVPAPPPDAWTWEARTAVELAMMRAVLFARMDIETRVEGKTLTVPRGKLTPEQWAMIFQALAALASAFATIFGPH